MAVKEKTKEQLAEEARYQLEGKQRRAWRNEILATLPACNKAEPGEPRALLAIENQKKIVEHMKKFKFVEPKKEG